MCKRLSCGRLKEKSSSFVFYVYIAYYVASLIRLVIRNLIVNESSLLIPKPGTTMIR